jgi:hypothetical protein
MKHIYRALGAGFTMVFALQLFLWLVQWIKFIVTGFFNL